MPLPNAWGRLRIHTMRPRPVLRLGFAHNLLAVSASSRLNRGPRHPHLSVVSEGKAPMRITSCGSRCGSPVVNAGETLGSPAENLLEVTSPLGQHEFELLFTGRVAGRAGTNLMWCHFLIATFGTFLGATRSNCDPIGK